jgi:type I restriction enzyme S subunit
MWAWMAALGVSKYHGIVSPSYGVYRSKEQDYNPDYLDFLLRQKYTAQNMYDAPPG